MVSLNKKEKFIESLFNNYNKFQWIRNEDSLTTNFGNYMVELNSGITGVVIRVRNYENNDSYNAYDDEFMLIPKLYNAVSDLIKHNTEEMFWKTALDELQHQVNSCINKK